MAPHGSLTGLAQVTNRPPPDVLRLAQAPGEVWRRPALEEVLPLAFEIHDVCVTKRNHGDVDNACVPVAKVGALDHVRDIAVPEHRVPRPHCRYRYEPMRAEVRMLLG